MSNQFDTIDLDFDWSKESEDAWLEEDLEWIFDLDEDDLVGWSDLEKEAKDKTRCEK